jgi:hypothetical protein
MGKYKLNNQKLDILLVDLEMRKRVDFEDLKLQFDSTLNSLKPMKLLTDSFTDFKEIPDIRNNFLSSAVSIVGGYFSKKLLLGKSNSFIKKALGYALQFGITKLISKKV